MKYGKFKHGKCGSTLSRRTVLLCANLISCAVGLFGGFKKNLVMLNSYPIVKQLGLFLRFNATPPSSAPVERLFSFAGIAGIIARPQRRKIENKLFEKLLLLKDNKLTELFVRFICFLSCYINLCCCLILSHLFIGLTALYEYLE